jgi:hypothetical protein
MIVQHAPVAGSGKGQGGWFVLDGVHVSYDHPVDAPFEHALNLDFVNGAQGPGARVAVELSVAGARALVATIEAVLAEAAAGGHLPPTPAA